MLKEAGRPHPHEEKVTTDLCCEIAVDCKIVPFERVPDYAGGNYSASLCGVHLTPQYLHSAQVSRGVSLVNLLAFNTMSLSPGARAASCASTAWYRGVIRRGVGSGQDGADAAHQTKRHSPISW